MAWPTTLLPWSQGSPRRRSRTGTWTGRQACAACNSRERAVVANDTVRWIRVCLAAVLVGLCILRAYDGGDARPRSSAPTNESCAAETPLLCRVQLGLAWALP